MSPDLKKVDIKEALSFFENLKKNNVNKGGDRPNRKPHDKFMPYVMIRSYAGDKGARPMAAGSVFWESPDIWTAVGDPASTPQIPPNQGGTAVAGKPNTVYAHVWNLGRAPIAGARVEWYWFNPSLGIDGAHAHLIGTTGVELNPRGFPGCHKLVKCPTAWVPVMENGGHECLVARISAFGDPLNPAHLWDSWADRHVAQRNIAVVAAKAEIHKLLGSLDFSRPKNSMVRLFQLGHEAAHAVALMAPHLKIDQAVKTNLLAELQANGHLTIPPLVTPFPRVMPHTILNLGARPVAPAAPAARMKPAAMDIHMKPAMDKPHLLHEAATVADLLHHGNLMSPDLVKRVEVLPPPKKGEAQVLRIISYQDNKPVGGYTIIVSG